MPVTRMPTTPALDGEWPDENENELPPPVALEPSGLFKTGVSGETDVDTSTRAEEAMEAAAGEPLPLERLIDPSSQPDVGAESSLVPILRPPARRFTFGWMVAGALLAGGLGAALVLQSSKNGSPIAIVAPPPGAALVAPDPPLPAAPQPKVVIPVEKVEPGRHGPVQFIFHVVPKNAEIRVDDRKLKAEKISLPWTEQTRRVHVSAPGYLPLSLTPPSTESRVFELRMERMQPAHKPKQSPSHDAAPVQDL
jgi:hypothetical protein